MSDEVKLPESVEEYQRALREAFVQGVYHGLDAAGHAVMEEPRETARRRYPIRRSQGKRIPSRGGWLSFTKDGALRWESGDRSFGHTLGADVVRDLLANPYEEVTE